MTTTYRTSGTWGSGKGSDLSESEVDNNFYSLVTKLDEIEATIPDAKIIKSITTQYNQFTITLTDDSTFGPFALPFGSFVYRGAWQPNTLYVKGDIVRVNITEVATGSETGLYYVNSRHISEITFNSESTNLSNFTYTKLSQLPYFNQIITPDFTTSIPAFTLLNYKIDVYLALEDINPANATALDNLITSGKVINISNIARINFSDLDDVAQYTPTNTSQFIKVNPTANGLSYGQPVFTDAIDAPGQYTNNALKVLRVNTAANAYEYKTLNFTDLNDITPYGLFSANYWVTVNGNANGLTFEPNVGSAFINRLDVPTSYTGKAINYVRVKSTQDGLEFTASLYNPFVGIPDVPQSYTASAGKYVSVNNATNGLEFVDGVNGAPRSTLTHLATQTPSGVTNIEFLNIPNTARRIFILFSGLKLSGSSDILIQFGNSSGYIATGYTVVYTYLRSGQNGSIGTTTTGFGIQGSSNTNTMYGYCTLSLLDSGTRIWDFNDVHALVQTGGNYYTCQGGGSKTLGAGVDVTKIKMVSLNGTDTFASGTTLSLAYE